MSEELKDAHDWCVANSFDCSVDSEPVPAVLVETLKPALQSLLDTIASQAAENAALRAEVERLRASIPKWIPVTERLPEAGVKIGVWSQKVSFLLASRAVRPGYSTPYGTMPAIDEIRDLFGNHIPAVTHWQPLPPTPTKETGHDD